MGELHLVKTNVIPLTKEEMNKLLEASINNDFYYMFFLVAKTTGRRIGELYGSRKKIEVSRKVVGKKIEYLDGKQIALDKTRANYKFLNEFQGGVKVKDIDFDKGLMKVWVLKRGKPVQDETILIPETLKTIRHYILKNKLTGEDYLFRAKSYRAIQEAVGAYAKRAGIDHVVSPHCFRHFMITELKKLNWTNDKISKLTGHKSVASLSAYDHVLASDIKEEAIKDLMRI